MSPSGSELPKAGPALAGPALLLPYAGITIGLLVVGNAWLSVLLYKGGLILFLVAARYPVVELVRGFRAGPALLGVALGVLGGLAWWLLAPWIHPEGLASDLQGMGLGRGAWIGFLVYFATLNPALEELYWRGWLRGTGALGDIAFGGYHALTLAPFVGWPWVAAAVVALAGTARLWRWWAARFGGLAVPTLSHAAAGVALGLAFQFRLGG